MTGWGAWLANLRITFLRKPHEKLTQLLRERKKDHKTATESSVCLLLWLLCEPHHHLGRPEDEEELAHQNLLQSEVLALSHEEDVLAQLQQLLRVEDLVDQQHGRQVSDVATDEPTNHKHHGHVETDDPRVHEEMVRESR